MIACLRIDDRLLHGQIITKWLTQYDPDAIVIADDNVMQNDIEKMALRMAKPDEMKMSIRGVDDAIKLINNEKTKDMRLFVLVKGSAEALRIAQSVSPIDVINIGGMRGNANAKKVVAGSLKLDEEDVANIKELVGMAKEIDTRIVPSDSKQDIMKLI